MSAQFLIGLLLCGLIGLSLGLLGGGGSIITVPVLVYLMGEDTHRAIAMSLAVVSATSLIGALLHYRQGTLRIRTALQFGFAGIIGAYLGAGLAYLLSPQLLMLIFALLMLTIALLMLKKGETKSTAAHTGGGLTALVVGALVGLLTGFLGVGGGFLIVPALIFFGGVPIKEAVGTSLLVIAINSTAGFLGHLRHNSIDAGLTLLITVLAVAGTVVGTALTRKISAEVLRKSFSMFTIAVAILLLIKNYAVLLQ